MSRKAEVSHLPTAAQWELEVKALRAQRDEVMDALSRVIAPPPNTEWADNLIEAQRVLARIREDSR